MVNIKIEPANGQRRRSSAEVAAKFVHGKIRVPDEHSAAGDMIGGEFVRSHGLHWIIATLVIGILSNSSNILKPCSGGYGRWGDDLKNFKIALPTAFQQTGIYAGVIACFVVFITTIFSAIFLGDCWRILLRHWPQYHHSFIRKPYAEIGYRAMGNFGKIIASVSVNLSQFGIVVVFLLVSSKNLHDFLSRHFNNVPHVCYWILMIGIVILPLSMLKSPEDFWLLIVISGMCTGSVVILIIVAGFIDFPVCHPESEQAPFKIMNMFIGLGTIVFAWGAHPTFPTIQHDLRRPKDFTKSILASFSIVTLFYTIVITVGTLTYGNSLRDSIIGSLQTPWIQQTVNILISMHCILSTLIMINPLNQEAEEFFKISQTFGIQRILVRGLMVTLLVLVAESIPSFGPVVNLIGASSFTLTCIVLPLLFYLFLKARENCLLETGKDDGPVSFREMQRHNTKIILIFCALTIVGGIAAGSIATGMSIREIASTKFEMPCYLRPFLSDEEDYFSTSTNCCGKFQNITSIAGVKPKHFCNMADFDFYK